MKKIKLLKGAGLLAIIILTSCSKKDTGPDTNKNSQLKMENIVFNDFIPTGSTSIRGVAKFEFYVENDSVSSVLDTLKFADTFYVTNPRNYTQSYDFNTPDKASTFNFSVNFTIDGGGSAESVQVESFFYKRNGNTYISDPLTFSGSSSSFTSQTKTVNF